LLLKMGLVALMLDPEGASYSRVLMVFYERRSST